METISIEFLGEPLHCTWDGERLSCSSYDLVAERVAAEISTTFPRPEVELLICLEDDLRAGAQLEEVGALLEPANREDQDEFCREAWRRHWASPMAVVAYADDMKLRSMVARNGHHPLTLAQLASSFDPELRAGCARNRNTPARAVARLLQDHDPSIRQLAAAHPALSTEQLQGLIASGDPRHLLGAAENPNLSQAQALHLAGMHLSIRYALTGRFPLEPEVAALLAEDKDPHILVALIQSQNCPLDILDRLSQHPDRMVNETAAFYAEKQRQALAGEMAIS